MKKKSVKKATRKTTRKTAAKKKAPAKATKTKKPAKPISPAQEANQITWLILGELKSTQIKHLRVGKLLCDVRDRKLHESLKFPDMESYAWDRLHLGRTSYYQYVQVYDWTKKFHPEWLVPHPKGFIPDLSDSADLMWIEEELTKQDLDPDLRATLETLKAKGLAGTLRQGELDKVRRKGNNKAEGLKSLLSKVRNIRMRGAQLASMPAEAIRLIDAAIVVIEKSLAQERSGLDAK